MDQYAEHWNGTLMGHDFWKTARLVDNEEKHESPPGFGLSALHIATDTSSLDTDLSKCFPFNQDLDMEQLPRSPDNELFKELPALPLSPLMETPFTESPMKTPKKEHRRTVSMSEAPRTPLQRFSSLAHSPRLHDLARRARSPSPLKRSAPVTPVGPRFWSVKTSAPNTPAPRWQLLSPVKRPESTTKTKTAVETVKVPESPAAFPRLASVFVDSATPAKPLVGFRGGPTWLSLPRDKSRLGLDLFWPCAHSQEEINCLDIMELKPLCQFRSLRSLKLVGMMQSYQTYIWQAAWLNLALDELELGMVLKPDIIGPIHGSQWRLIQEGWTMGRKQNAEPSYYGHLGNGELHSSIGYGEYLDKHSIEKAKLRAHAIGRTSQYLTIKTLTLSGFVVDADPFLQWFDPQRLRSIHFKGECIDAGFWLAPAMQKATVRCPRKIDLEDMPVGILTLNLQKDLKVIDLKNGKKVNEMVFGDSGIVLGRL